MMAAEVHYQRDDYIRLRPLSLFDAPLISELANDYDISSMVSAMPFPYEQVHAEQWVHDIEANHREEVWVIVYQGQIAGTVGYKRSSIAHGELGYWVGKPFWGLGIGTKAAAMIVSQAFYTEPFHYLTACHFHDNLVSKRIIEKLGFEPMGESVEYSLARKESIKCIRYHLTRQKFEMLSAPQDPAAYTPGQQVRLP